MPAPADVKAIFLEAAAIDDPVARMDLVNDRCGTDDALRGRVLALIVANDRAIANEGTATFGTADASDPSPTADLPGKDEHVGAILGGKYKLIEEIGEGGMGSVFMAQQAEPVRRAVAVKVIKAGMDTRAVLARFEAERQALALMDHPNIAKVLDAGTTDGGRPFFVMELVKGVPVTKFCDERKLTPRQRLELFVPVCQAIQHAHQKGVIHRDIKPNNVLVAMYDDRPVPKVIDFGVAKAAGQTLTDKTLLTGFGAVVGTPEYMSPEQASLNNLDVDTRSDVYSLGVPLYELLTGTTPVDRKSLGKAAVLEVLRIVREVEAPKPSAKLSTIDTLPSVATNRGTEPAKLPRLMKGELDCVVLRALEKDRARRYDTANALARDIQRYLADEVVEARPPSAGYRLKKFVRRHKGQVVAASLVLFALLLGLVGTAIGLAEAKRHQGLAEEAADREKGERTRAEENASQAVAAAGQLRLTRDELWSSLYASRARRIQSTWEANDVGRVRELLAEQLPPPGAADHRGFEWHYFDRLAHAELTVRPPPPAYAGVTQALYQLSPDGRILAVCVPADDPKGTTPRSIDLRDAATGDLLRTIPLGGTPRSTGWSIDFTEDGTGLFVFTRVPRDGRGQPVGSAHWWLYDTATGRERVPRQDVPAGVRELTVSADGTRVAALVANPDKKGAARMAVFDTATAKVVRELHGELLDVGGLRPLIRPDGKQILAIATKRTDETLPKPGQRPRIRPTVIVWDAETGAEVYALPSGGERPAYSASFFPDNKRLVVLDSRLRVLDAGTGRELSAVKPQTEYFGVDTANTRSDRILCENRLGNGYCDVVDAPTGRIHASVRYSGPSLCGMAFTPDGSRVVTLSRDGTVRTWDGTASELPAEMVGPLWAHLRPEGAPFESGPRAVLDDRFDPGTRTRTWTLCGRDAAGGGRGRVSWSAPADKPNGGGSLTREIALGADGRVAVVAFTPIQTGDGNAAAGSRGTRMMAFDLHAGKELWSQTPGRTLSHVRFSPDGRFVAALVYRPSDSGDPANRMSFVALVYEVRTGREVLSTTCGFTDGMSSSELHFTPDSTHFLNFGVETDGTPALRSWDLHSGTPLLTRTFPEWAERRCVAAELSPDGRRLVCSCSPPSRLDGGGVVRVLDVATGRVTASLEEANELPVLAFSPDGTRLAGVNRRNGGYPHISIWKTTTGQKLLDLALTLPKRGYLDGGIRRLEFSPDGHRLTVYGVVGVDYKAWKKEWDATPRSGAAR